MWWESRSNSATTSVHQSELAFRRCVGGFGAVGFDFKIISFKKADSTGEMLTQAKLLAG